MAAVSGGAACAEAILGVAALCATLGAGVVDERPAVPVAGVPGMVESDAAVGSTNDCLACAAVVRIAFISSMLFCLFLDGVEDDAGLLADVSVKEASRGCASCASGSAPRFLFSAGASLIGHAKPVLGVYAGRCWRSISNEVCRDCREVSCMG